MMLQCILLCFPAAGEAEVLTVGSKGNRVLQVKERLQRLGYLEQGSITKKYNEKTVAAVREFQRLNGLSETGDVDAVTEEKLFSDDAVRKPKPTLEPLPIPEAIDEDDWPERDAEGFLEGDGEFFYENDEAGQWAYLNRNLQIFIRRGKETSIPLEWFETEILTRNGESFRTAITDPEHPGKKFRYPYDISRDEGFVLGFSDDFYATRMADKETVGIIIREGRIISDKTNSKTGHHLPNLDMMAQYPDGRLEVYECTEFTAQELLDKGAVNVFSFGPILLRDGEINPLLYPYYRSIEPRHALGMIEPNHYLILSVQGRNKDSKGTMLQRVAEMMKERGVIQALNLDGGNTMALIFRGRMLNKLATFKKRNFVRTVTSLIGIGHTENQSE
jgi:peptidoglycan hydrolase-like protein with peptidoglycan-binding domain